MIMSPEIESLPSPQRPQIRSFKKTRDQAKKHGALNHRGKNPLKKLAKVQFEQVMTDRRILKEVGTFFSFFFQREGEFHWGKGFSSVLKVQL